nr:hypothetical protein [uncultured Duganella sp.]
MRQQRIDGFTPLDHGSIAAYVAAGERVIVQFGRSGYTNEQLAELNQLAKLHGRGLEIRFFGHYGEVFDGTFLRRLPDSMCVSLDCLSHARNLDALSHIEDLQELRLGVFELDDAEVLARCNAASMKVLSLGATRKRNIDLSHLARFAALESLHSTGETKNIEAICGLPILRDLSLSSFRKKDDIAFVSNLARLVSLRLMLGGRASIAELAAPALENLEVIRVQGLEDIGDCSRFESLRRLRVEDQIRLKGVRVASNPGLQEISIINCKNFQRIDGLDALPSLWSLRLFQTAVDYSTLMDGPLPATLSHVAFYTAKSRRDNEIAEDLRRRGFQLDAMYRQ